mgnify:FL=1
MHENKLVCNRLFTTHAFLFVFFNEKILFEASRADDLSTVFVHTLDRMTLLGCEYITAYVTGWLLFHCNIFIFIYYYICDVFIFLLQGLGMFPLR